MKARFINAFKEYEMKRLAIAILLIAAQNQPAFAGEDDLMDGACLVNTIICQKMENRWGPEDVDYLHCVKSASEGISYLVAEYFTSRPSITFLQASKQNQIIEYISGNEFTKEELKEATGKAFDLEGQAKQLSILKRGRKRSKLTDFDVRQDC